MKVEEGKKFITVTYDAGECVLITVDHYAELFKASNERDFYKEKYESMVSNLDLLAKAMKGIGKNE